MSGDSEEKGSSEAHSLLVKACLEELALMGYAAWPNRTGATQIGGRFIPFGKRGSGDIVVLLPRIIGTDLFAIHGEVECKTGKATQSKRQKTHMRIVRGNGGVYLVIRDGHEIPLRLAELGYAPRNPAYATSAVPALLL